MSAPRESATVVLARAGLTELEVYMVRRHPANDFVGGAYVFPGGALDACDVSSPVLAGLAGVDAEAAARRLGIDAERALGHLSCAIRETFEEAGVLLACQDGQPVSAAGPAAEAHWADRRRRLLDGELAWEAFVAEERLALAGERLGYFAYWITPEGAPKRFATRFFVAEAPAAQVPSPDAREVEDGLWIGPREALARHHAGHMPMILPTVRTLEELSGFKTPGALLEACAGRAVAPRLPRWVRRAGELVPLLPEDAGYGEAGGGSSA